ncbi:MAG: TlpA family protein disulfide reductase [Clostridiales bacterium]|nr:TlpA family protein disulfide reductase [Candidatus Blautia equi]
MRLKKFYRALAIGLASAMLFTAFPFAEEAGTADVAVEETAGEEAAAETDQNEKPKLTETVVRDDAALGIHFEITPEMDEMGLALYRTPVSRLNAIGELNIVFDKAFFGAILVVPKALFENGDKTMEDTYREQNPEYSYRKDEFENYVYFYIDCFDNLKLEDLEEEQVEKILACKPYYDEFLNSISYFTVVPEESKLTFDTVNMDGEQVTDSILGEKDVTILNVWATYCNPCINEMPDLAAWEKELPENVQILYWCSDVPSPAEGPEVELANTIVDTAGINRKNVLYYTQGSFSAIRPMITAVPTTFFIDREGNILDQTVVGAYVDRYKQTLMQLLAQILGN